MSVQVKELKSLLPWSVHCVFYGEEKLSSNQSHCLAVRKRRGEYKFVLRTVCTNSWPNPLLILDQGVAHLSQPFAVFGLALERGV